MRKNTKILLICILIPVLVGAVAGFLTSGSMDAYRQVIRPPLSPPGWLFPVVWTILYVLMGIASYLVLTSGGVREEITSALRVYAIQLAFNFLWSFLFFTFGQYCFAFVWLVLLWGLILYMMIKFRALSKTAAILLIPYVLWVTFAGYLNLSICLLN